MEARSLPIPTARVTRGYLTWHNALRGGAEIPGPSQYMGAEPNTVPKFPKRQGRTRPNGSKSRADIGHYLGSHRHECVQRRRPTCITDTMSLFTPHDTTL